MSFLNIKINYINLKILNNRGNEVNQLWKKEKEFVNARDLYFAAGGKYKLGFAYTQI